LGTGDKMRNDLNESITTAELVRNLSVVIDRVRSTGRRVAITKGSQTVAELSPPAKGGYPIARLGELLASLPKLDADVQTMADDLASIRSAGELPDSPWDS
jgi:antitoxin (DNA-binding transcriptional repressor) of toxin-antitoxin stability system